MNAVNWMRFLNNISKEDFQKSILKFNIYNQALQSAGGISSTSTSIDSGNKTEKDLLVWRRKLDDAKNKTIAKKDQLLGLQDKQRELNKEQLDVNNDDNPQMRTIRMLENRLDKAMIKYNEAMSIKKTYELIVKRLKDERVGYDN